MNVNEQPMGQDDDLTQGADDDSELDVEDTPPPSEPTSSVQPTVGRSANIGHNNANPTNK